LQSYSGSFLNGRCRYFIAYGFLNQYGVRNLFCLAGKTMTTQLSKDPLHGITLEALLNTLVDRYGWAELAKRININCFKSDPSIKSSLKFLRRTPWARKEVEDLYIESLHEQDDIKEDAGAENPWANWQGRINVNAAISSDSIKRR
jgi:uncharacterized protein (DUF2132 family)